MTDYDSWQYLQQISIAYEFSHHIGSCFRCSCSAVHLLSDNCKSLRKMISTCDILEPLKKLSVFQMCTQTRSTAGEIQSLSQHLPTRPPGIKCWKETLMSAARYLHSRAWGARERGECEHDEAISGCCILKVCGNGCRLTLSAFLWLNEIFISSGCWGVFSKRSRPCRHVRLFFCFVFVSWFRFICILRWNHRPEKLLIQLFNSNYGQNKNIVIFVISGKQPIFSSVMFRGRSILPNHRRRKKTFSHLFFVVSGKVCVICFRCQANNGAEWDFICIWQFFPRAIFLLG